MAIPLRRTTFTTNRALEFFSEWKTVYVDFSGKLQKAQIDNN